ncbi:hypothetical protein SPURM210S_06180 [Streptomyces purpurascens]
MGVLFRHAARLSETPTPATGRERSTGEKRRVFLESKA